MFGPCSGLDRYLTLLTEITGLEKRYHAQRAMPPGVGTITCNAVYIHRPHAVFVVLSCIVVLQAQGPAEEGRRRQEDVYVCMHTHLCAYVGMGGYTD